MSVKIDWLSFSAPVRYAAPTDEGYAVAIESALVELLGQWLTDALFKAKWELTEHGRQPYKHVWKRTDAPVLLFTHPNLNHMTVEFSGQAMDWLRKEGLQYELLERVSDRVTRLDVAVDIETAFSPIRFCDAGYSKRFAAKGVFESDTGQTVYVGSQKSDKFARVYRYYEPHPRSNLLRVEFVLRRDKAKVCARMLSHSTLEALASTLGEEFGWQHEAWSLHGSDTLNLSTVRGDRTNAGTIRWLMTSVAPAFKRLVASGEIPDAEQFVRSYFLGID